MNTGRHELTFTTPARAWTEALPLGNGHIGAMVHAATHGVRLQINDDTCWSGSPAANDREPLIAPEVARQIMASARAAVLRGDHAEAGAQVQRLQHRHTQSYLPFADLHVEVTAGDGPPSAFRRRLDLADAVHETRTAGDGWSVTQTTRVSAPHDVLVHELVASAAIDVVVTLSSPLRTIASGRDGTERSLLVRMPDDVAPSHDDADDGIVWADGESLQGAAVLRVIHDGTPVADGDGDGDGNGDCRLVLAGVTRLAVVYASATTFTGIGRAPEGDAHSAYDAARARVDRALADGLDVVRERQAADHRSLYERAELVLTGDEDATLDARLTAANRGETADLTTDPALAALMFHYGRYLLICSSRPGTLPANLQGIWNDSMRPPWSSNYTTNINLQMNYWAADVAGLPELAEPYLDLVEALAREGRRTATELYGLPGWAAHHNSDAWAYTRPVGGGTHHPKWSFWPLAGLWLCRQYLDGAAFRGEPADLLRRAFPVLRSAAEFALGWLVETGDGYLGTAPSSSPENDFLTPDGAIGEVAVSSTLDVTLVGDHLRSLVRVAASLGITGDDVVERAREAEKRLPGIPVGPSGAVLEWRDAFEQADPHHRHVSPLLFLYPGDGAVTPDQERAARVFLDERGDDSTGWSLAWKLALWARLRDGRRLDDLLALVFRDLTVDRGPEVGGVYPNLLAAHPPFQIDGNLGFVAGVAEALLQSHRGEIELLPALPPSLGDGRVRGLVARPGVGVDLAWENGQVVEATLTALHARALGGHTVRCSGRTAAVELTAIGEPVAVEVRQLRQPGRA
ncbi:glycosyl hydrolase family 95 catalytic domain-containing protein [Myceligenerans crystallogenes]|uniref:Glycoside hydrolase N-terminal domain-containing protein n=1 Tax=Myceligenerans crystallogenes TaxID=316335 RepID=A0ABP4ZNX0_9MICO